MQDIADLIISSLFYYVPDENKFTGFNAKYWLHALLELFLVVFLAFFVLITGMTFKLALTVKPVEFATLFLAILFAVITLLTFFRVFLYTRAFIRVTKKLRG